jgi:hypothetical protein
MNVLIVRLSMTWRVRIKETISIPFAFKGSSFEAVFGFISNKLSISTTFLFIKMLLYVKSYDLTVGIKI